MEPTAVYRRDRVSSIDVLRGIIMVIMALDHVRDFTHIVGVTDSPTNLATTTAPLFFTRWITHFCAPLFVFLSGISAYLNGQKKSTAQLASFLVKRGIWLVLADIFIVTLVMSFNPLYSFILLQVIWAIGWGMIILGLLLRGGYRLVAVIGIVLFFGHNITDYFQPPANGTVRTIVEIIFNTPGTIITYGSGRIILVAYAIIPWTGVLLMGYAFGRFFGKMTSPEKRRKTLLTAGLLITGLFILLRLVNEYGDPAPWSRQGSGLFTFLSFLNVTKYPPSLMFCCMTIGPGLIILSVADRWKGRLPDFFTVYGKVPFFYFVMHFLLIHIITVVLFFATGHSVAEAADPASPFLFRPAEFGFRLRIVYLIWIAVVLLMYYPCRWYMNYKATHDKWWLSYV
ncbi:MAG: DUF1624 domain-containing protein [Chitinophagaceae bacterium]|nr:MAG: DUF1624 domain-containing protein [Chitinophagaceae bacterium]